MKNSYLFTPGILALFAIAMLAPGKAISQNDTTWTFNPDQLTPSPTGYYISGREKDLNEDGEPELHKGCVDAYGNYSHEENLDHNEFGTQQGWTYGNAMIMPTCEGKGTPPSSDFDNVGYIELGQSRNLGSDSAQLTYIISPAIRNLKSLKLRVGTDLSLNGRDIYFGVAVMTDTADQLGQNATLLTQTFRFAQQFSNQGGETFTYMADGNTQAFNEMVNLSQNQNIYLRIISEPVGGTPHGYRVKIFGIELTASRAVDDNTPNKITGAKDVKTSSKPLFTIQNQTFHATGNTIYVYDYMGRNIGSGKSVTIPGNGIYIIKGQNGQSEKALIQ